MKRDYDSTVARIAGNLLSGLFDREDYRAVAANNDTLWPQVYGAVLVAQQIARACRYTNHTETETDDES